MGSCQSFHICILNFEFKISGNQIFCQEIFFLAARLNFLSRGEQNGDGTLSGYSEAAPKMRSRGPTPPFSPSLKPRQLFPIRNQQHGSIVFLIEHAGGKEIFN
jgi:hypothetical protein